VLLSFLPPRLQCILCCCCPCLQSCNALCVAVFPACKVAMQSSLQASGAAYTLACARDTFYNCCRQRCDAMGDGECKATAGVGHRSPLHHCPATAPRSRSVLAGLQPDRPCPGEVPLVPCFGFLSFPVISFCHCFLSFPVIIFCHCFLSLPVVISCH